MRFYTPVLLLLLATSAFCQQTVTITGEAFLPGQPAEVVILSPLKDPVGDNFIHLANIPVQLNNTFKYKLKLSQPQFIEIQFQRLQSLIYVVPGDSIHLNFEELAKPDTVKTLWANNFYSVRLHVSGNGQARIAFFERLQAKTGCLQGPPFSIPRDMVDFYKVYKTKVNEVYQQRLEILNTETAANHFTDEFKAAALNEIQGEYLTDLMFPTFDSQNLVGTPSGYFKEVNDYEMTWGKFKNSKSNLMASYINIKYYNRPNRNETEEQAFMTVINNCMRFKDVAVRNYLLTQMLTRNIKERPSNFDEVLKKYQELCTEQSYKDSVISLLKSN